MRSSVEAKIIIQFCYSFPKILLANYYLNIMCFMNGNSTRINPLWCTLCALHFHPNHPRPHIVPTVCQIIATIWKRTRFWIFGDKFIVTFVKVVDFSIRELAVEFIFFQKIRQTRKLRNFVIFYSLTQILESFIGWL